MKRTDNAASCWFSWLCEHCHGSSGHGGNLAGMRALYWGEEAFVIRCCGYLFRVSENDFKYCTGQV